LILSILLPGFHRIHAQLSVDEFELAAYIVMPEMLLYKILEKADDYLLIDVRKRDEYRVGHIVGAVNLPWEDGTFNEGKDELPRELSIVLVSEDGGEALKALRVLLLEEYENPQSRFREVSSIEGGMDNWPYGAYIVRE
jgi:rhodanese-related sulfurtransferase